MMNGMMGTHFGMGIPNSRIINKMMPKQVVTQNVIIAKTSRASRTNVPNSRLEGLQYVQKRLIFPISANAHPDCPAWQVRIGSAALVYPLALITYFRM